MEFFWNPQSTYLTYSKDEKSRMSNEYYKKLALKYIGAKNISFFFSGIVLKLSEIFWNVWIVSGLWFGFLAIFF